MRIFGSLTAFIAAVLASPLLTAELRPETIGSVETLPEVYPDHWVMVQDFALFHWLEGRIVVVDPLAATTGDQVKGTLTASFIASYQHSERRKEHYVVESFFSRGGRGGERTDVVTIYDPTTLDVVGEVVIPPKRLTGVPKPLVSAMIDDERFLLVYNFTPSQSVSVVDLDARELVAEIPTPGCGFVIPTAQRSFTSICSNGSMQTTHLDESGRPAGTGKTDVLFDVATDPVFEAAAMFDGIAYFPTFAGRVLPIDLRTMEIEPGEPWWLTDDHERHWRPGGVKPVATDASGLGYFLMNPEGGDGTHKDGGSEVWVYDLAAGKRISRIELETWGLSLGTTGTGDGRLLTVTNAQMGVDVYRLPAGEFVQTLAIAAEAPLMVHGAH